MTHSGVTPNEGILHMRRESFFGAPNTTGAKHLLAGNVPGTCDVENSEAGDIADILWVNGVLYVASSSLLTLDATRYTHPEFLNPDAGLPVTSSTNGLDGRLCPRALAAWGRYLYVVADQRSTCTFTGFAQDQERAGDWLYVFDISVPAQPVEVGRVDVGEEVRAIAINGNMAYLASLAGERVLLADVTDRSAPYVVGAFGSVGESVDIAVHGPEIYVNGVSAGVRVIDAR
jgi:hypothetical protein